MCQRESEEKCTVRGALHTIVYISLEVPSFALFLIRCFAVMDLNSVLGWSNGRILPLFQPNICYTLGYTVLHQLFLSQLLKDEISRKMNFLSCLSVLSKVCKLGPKEFTRENFFYYKYIFQPLRAYDADGSRAFILTAWRSPVRS